LPLHREPIRSGHVFLFGLDADVDACAATVALAQSVTVTGQASITGSFAIGNASFTPLNAPAVTSMGFSPSTLTDLPVVTLPSGANVPSAGDQSGAFVNGEMIYYPWMVANGGSNWQEQIELVLPREPPRFRSVSWAASAQSTPAIRPCSGTQYAWVVLCIPRRS
jgi:hypothetical protein